MGWRAIRIGLDRPALLRRQLRALLHAAAGRSLWVMFPMISDVAEFEAAKALLRRELEREKAFGDHADADGLGHLLRRQTRVQHAAILGRAVALPGHGSGGKIAPALIGQPPLAPLPILAPHRVEIVK